MTEEIEHGRLTTYLLGYVICTILTLAAFFLIMKRTFPPHINVPIILTLAGVQMVAQVQFFLHLGNERKPRWNTITFGFMLLIVAIVIGGTLWIMHTLNTRVMPTPQEIFH